MEKRELKVTIGDNGKRLDLYGVLYSDNLSRNSLRKLLDSGLVKVNGEVEYRPNYKVKTDDLVEIPLEIDTVAQNYDQIVPENIPIEVIYEDKDLLVVNKPAGMVIHPATGNGSGTLMNAVHYHFKQIRDVGDKIRSGLIHRLDKDTSGLVLIGKTSRGLWYYSRLFAERQIQKKYLAIVAGNIEPKLQDGLIHIENYLGRNPKNRMKFTEVSPTRGRYAETDIYLIKRISKDGQEYSLVEVHPKTGRTHQIRVHLSGLGFPVLGDRIYGRHNEYSRLMLHAWRLKLVLQDGRETEFEALSPVDFRDF